VSEQRTVAMNTRRAVADLLPIPGVVLFALSPHVAPVWAFYCVMLAIGFVIAAVVLRAG